MSLSKVMSQETTTVGPLFVSDMGQIWKQMSGPSRVPIKAGPGPLRENILSLLSIQKILEYQIGIPYKTQNLNV